LNVVTPVEILERHSTDAIRYWACSGRLGTDTAIDEGQMKIGRKLAIKLLNASRFVLGSVAPEGPDDPAAVTAAVDRSLLASLASLVEEATAAFEGYDHARALERTEAWFWGFCDDYLELVKARAYNREGTFPEPAAASARAALRLALSVLVRLLAPILPFTAEEVWSWSHDGAATSVHRAPWPVVEELTAAVAGGASRPGPTGAGSPEATGADGDGAYREAAEALRALRRAKTEAGSSLRAPVVRLVVRADAGTLSRLRGASGDLAEAGAVEAFEWVEVTGGDQAGFEVVLAR
ncbi:MAG: class I tRNA ligase family protein, partial [Actinomycetota bacterium]|nr:class I tRNA ligase family protein [Actinomycetota bacterium]